MMSETVRLSDIDADQWRELQRLLLRSASARAHIVVIHDRGTLLKLAHSRGRTVDRSIDHVERPREAAEVVYAANEANADYVVVFERGAVERYFTSLQDGWTPDELVDGYERRKHALLAAAGDGIVTFPDSPDATLGLQWRIGASFAAVETALRRFVAAGTHAVFATFEGEALSSSLVLVLNDDGDVTRITTADPAAVALHGNRQEVAARIVSWSETAHGRCSLGLFVDRDEAERLLAAPRSDRLRTAVETGRAILAPCPAPLASLLGAAS